LVYDVPFAGAGPVGLFLACELRLAKLSVMVLEQLEDPYSSLKRLPFGMRGLWGPRKDRAEKSGKTCIAQWRSTLPWFQEERKDMSGKRAGRRA
jgi:hypothetical protein